MSTLLQRIMIALGQRGVRVPIDATLANAYRGLEHYHEMYPSVFHEAAEILVSEVEGGATGLAELPERLDQLCKMLDRLHRREELESWAEEPLIIRA